MTETAVRKQVTHRWYTRPVLFVADGLDELRREIVERSVPSKKSWWGYDVVQIIDPDGNELLFPISE